MSTRIRQRRIRLLNPFTAAVAALAMALFVAAPGCNTLEGAGEDVEAAGESIEEAAE